MAIPNTTEREIPPTHPGEALREDFMPILVVMPEGADRRETTKLLYKKRAGYGIPVDLIVATPGDLEKHKDNIGRIYRTALKEGKALYAA